MKLPPKKGTSIHINKTNTLLIDGSSIFKRGIKANNDKISSYGSDIGGLYYVLTTLKKLLNDNIYHKVYIFFDGKRSGLNRFKIYKDYKSGRGKNYVDGTEPEDQNEIFQKQLVTEYLYNLSIREIMSEDTEADDYIAYYVKIHKGIEDMTIATSDRDLCTLISDGISVYLIDKKKVISSDTYEEEFGHHIGNLKLIKIVCGDNSDSIKGITGVQEKGFVKLFPEIKERTLSIDDILLLSEKIRSERIENKLKPIAKVENILNRVTNGIQGKDIFEINNELVDLSNPKITDDDMKMFDKIILEGMKVTGDFNEVHKLISREGIDQYINEYYMSDWLLPFKKFINRIDKLNN